jgi:Tol biopolymer transport system component
MQRLVCGLSCAALGILVLTAPTDAQATSRVSVDSSGAQGNGLSRLPTISADGRFVVFQSDASNLVAGDTNGVEDIFVHDRTTGITERVSIDSAGAQANDGSGSPTMSPDGRYVAFNSSAKNLVAGDTNGWADVFVHDRSTGLTERVSVDSSGAEVLADSFEPAISADGQIVSWDSYGQTFVAGDFNLTKDIFVHDRSTGLTELVSVSSSGTQGNDQSSLSALSGDGRFVAFQSKATTFFAGDFNGEYDLFVHDRSTGLTECVSVDSSGALGNHHSFHVAISPDGQIVAFTSASDNLVAVDTNAAFDIFVHDLSTGITELCSVSTSGTQGNNKNCDEPTLSADGQIVAFWSMANTLVPGDTNNKTDVFVHDRSTGVTERVSVDSSGAQGNGDCSVSSLSADGQIVAFAGAANNLVAGDTNGVEDIFVHVRTPWTDLGFGLAGVAGVPSLVGTGSLEAGSSGNLALTQAKASALTILFVSLTSTPTPFKGGTLATVPVTLSVPLSTGAAGSFKLPWVWPSGVPSAVPLYFQFAIQDAAALKGVSLSNALKAVTP